MRTSTIKFLLFFFIIWSLIFSIFAFYSFFKNQKEKKNQQQELKINYVYLNQPISSKIASDKLNEEEEDYNSPYISNKERQNLKEVIVDENYGADKYDTFIKNPKIPRHKVKIGNVIKNSFIIRVPSTIEKDLIINGKSYLDFSISVYQRPKGNVRFLVGIKKLNKIYPFLIKHFGQIQTEKERTWYNIRLDLSSYVKKNIKIVFDFKNVDPPTTKIESKTSSNKFVFLSDPILTQISKKPAYPNIIFISIDTLRQDHLGCYGYERDTSPNIDDLLKDKQTVIFDNVISQSHWTLPSHMSMFTSQYASTHQIYMDRLLNEENITFPMILKKNNFLNYGFVTHVRVNSKYGFERGFDSFWFEEHNFSSEKARVQDIIPKILEFLKKYKKNTFFLFIHLFDVHSPYTPPIPFDTIFDKNYYGNVSGYDSDLFVKPLFSPETKNKISERDLQHIISLYDGEIRNVDFHLGVLFSHLKKLNLFDNSLIILTSDHGEEFQEHGSMHHDTLYDEVIKIPLIIKMPKNIQVANNRIGHQLIQGNIDIAPTILDILNLDIPTEFQGNSLLPIIKGQKEKGPSHQVSEKLSDWDTKIYQISVRDMSYKYIYTTFFDIKNIKNFQRKNEKFELYDLLNDEYEKFNLALSNDKINLYYQGLVYNFVFKNVLHTNKIPKKIELDEELIERLKSLGYIK